MPKTLFLVVLLLGTFANYALGYSCVASLYTQDKIWSGLEFTTGTTAYEIDNYQLKNEQSDIIFDTYVTGGLTIGPQGGTQGAFVDLGSASDLITKYGITNIGNESIYYTIYLDATSKLLYGKARDATDKITFAQFDTAQTAPLYVPLTSPTITPPIPGNIYLIRITSNTDPKNPVERIVKMLVVKINADEVRIRWDVLKDTTTKGLDPEDDYCGFAADSESVDTIVPIPEEPDTSTAGWVTAFVIILIIATVALIVFSLYLWRSVRYHVHRYMVQ